MKVDAIVNAADTSLPDGGGVDGCMPQDLTCCEAICEFRSSASLGADWKQRIDEDYEKRENRRKK